METVDCIVIGAGVAGLSVAAAMAASGFETLVLERGDAPGRGVSERNSGVIHAGLYYPADSLKTRLCRRGNTLLYQFCQEYGVPHRRLGKWVVAATSAEVPRLQALATHARDVGLADTTVVGADELRASEPAVTGVAALWSPSSGIVDVPAMIKALEARLEAAGGTLALKAPVTSVAPSDTGMRVTIGEEAPITVCCRFLVNAAGLGAQDVAHVVSGLAPHHIPPRFLSKGNYFSYHGRSPFNHLIYPLPEPGGLGVHATLDMAGALRFGPDVEPIDRLDYTPDEGRKARFLASIRRYFPDVEPERLMPDYAGVRPKIVPADQTADFAVSGPRTHGVAGLVNIFGYESPGLTASLALGEWLAYAATRSALASL